MHIKSPPSLSNESLLADIAATDSGSGQAAFWWLGQHSFIIKIDGKVIYIDPYLDQNPARQTPPLLHFSELSNADLVLVTHDHGDHLCPESLRSLCRYSPFSRFIGPRTASNRMLIDCGIPPDRLVSLSAGEVVEIYGIRVTAIKGKHEFFDEDPELGFPWLGYVVEADGLTFYHAGDTIMYEGLLAALKVWPHFDVMFIPINGRDAERYLRNCMGNFTFQEAAELAGELHPGLAVPAHYDMFIGNQEDPSKFVDFLNAKYPGVKSWVGPPGVCVHVG
jgi:L-ascorbate 6-phosphate lactonase